MSDLNFNFRVARSWYLWRMRSDSFFGSQWAGGIMLVIFAAIALVIANNPTTSHWYHHILESDVGFNFGRFRGSLSVEQWINDALMAIFFFVVGLEIKREIVAGELSNIKKASLPIAAAIGGMVVPALIYVMFNAGTEYSSGWGIPMATDIAFAIGILSLFGKRVPLALKVFLTALAIVDDLGAILVIALFYTSHIDLPMLMFALLILFLLFMLNRSGVKGIVFYLVPGFFIWYMFLHSGVHATIAGVLVAMTIPTKPRFSKKYFIYKVRYFLEEFRFYDKPGVEVISNHNQFNALHKAGIVSLLSVSPAQRLEHVLNPFVTFFVIPVFALANAGVEIESFSQLRILAGSQGMGIFLGLVVGKPLGILILCWLCIKCRLAVMPEGGSWGTLFGVACLGGIGFTMSIFIDNLAFTNPAFVDAGKISVLMASITAAIIGALVINTVTRKKMPQARNR